uniref:Uncharacterized protein n=1 Tax=Anguilla anguilla TaxID=7936 RepID=A0A0E9Y2N6_ANGAN
MKAFVFWFCSVISTALLLHKDA